MKKFLAGIFVVVGASLHGCGSLDSVKPADRNTWMYFYGGLGNYEAVAAEPTEDGGYLIIGDSISAVNYGIVAIKTDKYGKEVWRQNIMRGGASALKVTPSGYFIIGSGIYVDLNEQAVIQQVKTKMRLLQLSTSGAIVKDVIDGNDSTYNYHGNSLAVSDPFLYVIGDQKKISNTATAYLTTKISTYNLSDLTLHDSSFYLLDNRDYVNAKSVQITSTGDLAWVMSAELVNSSATRSFIRLPVLAENTFTNGDNIGGVLDNYQAADFQPSGTSFGVVGTYASASGTKSNIFFVRTTSQADLTLQSSNIQYFDGAQLIATNSTITDKDASTSEDQGLALTGTDDGGFLLACSTSSTQTGKDLLLIKLDFTGKLMWFKTIGGSGDEIASTVRQTADGGYLISGTLDLAGLKSMFLLKTNAAGALAD